MMPWVKALVGLFELQGEQIALFKWSTVFTWKNNSQNMVIQTWIYGSNSAQNKSSYPITLRKTTEIFFLTYNNSYAFK